jgi:hypothetical protein
MAASIRYCDQRRVELFALFPMRQSIQSTRPCRAIQSASRPQTRLPIDRFETHNLSHKYVVSLYHYHHPPSSIHHHYQAIRQRGTRPVNRKIFTHPRTRTRIIGTPHTYIPTFWSITATRKRKTMQRKEFQYEREEETIREESNIEIE